jgi:hypothetical protein
MISAKFSTNPESFIKFRRGRRMTWQLPMDIPSYDQTSEDLTYSSINQESAYMIEIHFMLNTFLCV